VRIAAIAFPVGDIIDGGTWQDFTTAVRDACRRSARLANWGVTQLAIAEPKPGAADKLGKSPNVYLYGLLDGYAGRSDWTGAMTSANAVLRRAQQRYARFRKDVFGSHMATLPTSRRTNPYPVPAQNWTALWQETVGEDGQVMRQPAVSFQVGGRRWTVRLRNVQRRNLPAFTAMVTGEATRAELILTWQPGSGSHRRGGSDRLPGGGNSRASRYMLRLVAELPREERKGARRGTLEVATARNALLVATAPGADRPWFYHADQVRRRIVSYERRRQNVSDDMKAEWRMPRRRRERIVGRQQDMAAPHHRYMNSEICRAAAMLVGFAVRRRLTGLVYDDRERRYVSLFPWHELERRIREACAREGVEYKHVASDEVVDETPDPARENGKED
jgi:hypothetical protein